MNFPTATNLGPFLFTGPLVLCFCLFLTVKYIRYLVVVYVLRSTPVPNSTSKMKLPEGHMMLPFILVTLLIGSLHFWGAYSSMSNGNAFKSMKPGDIRAIEIQKLNDRDEPDGRSEKIEDPALIADFFASSSGARSYSRNHEHFYDGYLMHLARKDPGSGKDCYITVYKKSKQYRQVDKIVDMDLVVPHVGIMSGGAVNDAGEFMCPPMGDWVRKHVDPLFEKVKN